jgi:hypothetical protein
MLYMQTGHRSKEHKLLLDSDQVCSSIHTNSNTLCSECTVLVAVVVLESTAVLRCSDGAVMHTTSTRL